MKAVLRPVFPGVGRFVCGVPGWAAALTCRFVRQEKRGDFFRDTRWPERFGVDTAPTRFYFRQDFFAAFDHRIVKGACALDFFDNHRCDDRIVKKCGLAIGNFMFQRDPEMGCDSLGRGDFLPMRKNGFLHPVEIIGIVHMTHEINIFRLNGDRMFMAGIFDVGHDLATRLHCNLPYSLYLLPVKLHGKDLRRTAFNLG